MINKSNYETYVLDYLEGSLSPQAQKSMENFLKHNPAISSELEGLKEIVLVADETIVFPDKESLKRKGRLVPMPFFRRPMVRIALVAASLVGLFLVGQHLFESGGNIENPVVRSETVDKTLENELETKHDKNFLLIESVTKQENSQRGLPADIQTVATSNQATRAVVDKREPTVEKHVSLTKNEYKKGVEKEIAPYNVVERTPAEQQGAGSPVVQEIEPAPVASEGVGALEKGDTPVVLEKPQNAIAAEEKAGENEVVDPLEIPKGIAPIAQTTRKRARRVVFFPKLKEKLSPSALRDALLPEAISTEE